MKAKEDLRIRKTKKSLYDGLIVLLKDKNFESIKVSDICTAAMINRSTFYDHFDDKYDLLNCLLRDFIEGFQVEGDSFNQITSTKQFYISAVKQFLIHYKKFPEIYKSIIKQNYNSVAFDMFKNAMYNKALEIFDKYWIEDDTIPINICISFYIPAIVNVCFEYIVNSDKYTEEEILSYLDELICYHDYQNLKKETNNK